MSLNRIWMGSPNYSSRGGATVRLIVIHASEGAQTGASLGNFFANPSSGVSSHTGIDPTPNTCYEYVRRDQKAWTASSANPVAVQTELCTPSGASASFTAADWQPYLPNLAQWIKEESAAFGIPMVRLSPQQAQGSGRGVCEHADLGSWGGGHVDCGPNFPLDQVLQMAGGSSPTPTPPTPAAPPAGGVPPFPGVLLSNFTEHPSARAWQQQMVTRGWNLAVDGQYGTESENVCRQFQAEKGLGVDGVVGPETWAASWTAPIT